MSIYNNIEEYAKQTFMTTEQATIRCAHFKELEQKTHEAKKCPKCGKHMLAIETGSYEEGTHDYVYCENEQVLVVDEDGDECFTDCDFTSDVETEYEPIWHWYDFDEVLAFSIELETEYKKEVETHIGSSWLEFVEASNKKLVSIENAK